MDSSSRSRATPESWSHSASGRDESSLLVGRKRGLSPSDSFTATKRVPPSVTKDNGSDSFTEHRVFSRLLPAQHNMKASSEDNNNSRVSDNLLNGTCASSSEPIDNPSLSGQNVDQECNFDRCICIREIVESCSVFWSAKLILRNFDFPSKMFLFSGKKLTIEKYITKLDGDSCETCPTLRITQRWRLHPQPKLEEVKRRMQTGNLGMIIMTSRSNDCTSTLQSPSADTKSPTAGGEQSNRRDSTDQNNGSTSKETEGGENLTDNVPANQPSLPSTQSRPLKNLISYLEQKDAAGVISLSSNDTNESSTPSESAPKLLYAFPPGNFAFNLLKRKAPNLAIDLAGKEEYLLGVIVGGSEGKI